MTQVVAPKTSVMQAVFLVDAAGTPVGESEGDYQAVAASQTDKTLGATGAKGDVLQQVLVIPATTSPGAISVKDGGGSAITLFAGGASSLASLQPFTIQTGLTSAVGAWTVTTGANLSIVASGSFT